ncbi:MAG: DsbE family thiol:disulfide interchange protein [Alphaproteobacteria bacterium]|jgi:cytochrome c biogenesis protein CcmG/thiol:disulfide interchange protein DsbE
MMRRFIPLLIFAVFALMTAVTLVKRNQPAPLSETTQKPLPTLALTALNNPARTFDAAALKSRVTLLNVFASWCLPCMEEMDELQQLAKQFPALHIEGIVWNDSPGAIRAFLKQHGNPFRFLWQDKTGQAAIALGLRGVPESYLIDSRGQIFHRISGPIDARMREETLAPLITRSLAEADNAR